MLKAINTKVVLSGATVLAAAALIIGGTFAFFSDTETSTGNVLAAGAIDLEIDNESYVTDTDSGRLIFSDDTSWSDLRDLTEEKFFNFIDLKPGDIGEDTISIHVDNNDAWACMNWTITARDENDQTEPEIEDGDVTVDIGELQNFINFVWWPDDGDNVLEADEAPNAIFTGTLEEMDGLSVALADSSVNSVFDKPISGGETVYIGKAWCFGDMELDAVGQDDLGKVGTPQNPDNIPNGPLDRDPGILCDGELVNNTSQTDLVEGTMSFLAVQSRNNDDFLCNPPGTDGNTNTNAN